MKVAVYGSLMSGLHNHSRLNDSKFVGQFESQPKFKLIDLGAYPGLLKKGNTSVTMEVYEIDDIVLGNLDSLEGYDSEKPEKSYYKRELIKTPYGEAYYYIFNGDDIRPGEIEVKHGNWKEHTQIKKLKAV